MYNSKLNAIRDTIRKNREEEVRLDLEDLIALQSAEGYEVSFGTIGKKTTYALVNTSDHLEEYVGYTYVRDIRYYNETLGKLKALQQAVARKEALRSESF